MTTRSRGAPSVDLWDFQVESSDAGVIATDSSQVAVTNNRFGKIEQQAVVIDSSPGARCRPSARW